MTTNRRRPTLIFALAILIFVPGASQAGLCSQSHLLQKNLPIKLTPAPGQTQLRPEDIGVLRILTYNTENFFDFVGKFERTEPYNLKPTDQGPRPKAPWKVDGTAQIFKEQQPALASVQEIEGEGTIDRFSSQKLSSTYDGIAIPGNDQRGIQVGIMANRKYPFEIEIRSNRHIKWKDPAENFTERTLFARDALVSIVRLPGYRTPILIQITLHLKSKRDRPGDPESLQWRTAEAAEVARITSRLQSEFGADAPIMVLGDTNSDVNKGSELAPLRQLGFRDALDLAKLPVGERLTHIYFPPRKPGPNGEPQAPRAHAQQMDAILLSPSLQPYFKSANIVRYRDQEGYIIALPRSYHEREEIQPSDHFPIFVDLDFAPLIARALRAQ